MTGDCFYLLFLAIDEAMIISPFKMVYTPHLHQKLFDKHDYSLFGTAILGLENTERPILELTCVNLTW